jgi:hypothetical protein
MPVGIETNNIQEELKMTKLLVVLVSLGLIVAFSATASAVDVKFSGSYYVVGWYADNVKLADKTVASAAFWQRFRIQPVFVVAEGLSLTGRFDAMEKGWGSTNWRGGQDDMNLSRKAVVAGGAPNAQENFEWERGYVTFATAIGVFDVGYMSSGKWGTDFADDEKTRPRIKFATQAGPWTFLFIYEKQFESNYAHATPYPAQALQNDADNDNYNLAAIYNFKGGNAGLLYQYVQNNANRPIGSKAEVHKIVPYVKATFGPIYLESEVVYVTGKASKVEAPFAAGTTDTNWDALGAYLKIRANMGPAYFGFAGQLMPGWDRTDLTKKSDFANASGNGSQDLDVGLILGNDWLQTWQGNSGQGGANGVKFDSAKYNSIFYSVFAGFNPTPKLNIEATALTATLDKDVWCNSSSSYTSKIVSKNLGMEFDITAKYKIYDNLTYMVGAGYLWAGDAFKGTNSDNKVGNDYLLINRLALSF